MNHGCLIDHRLGFHGLMGGGGWRLSHRARGRGGGIAWGWRTHLCGSEGGVDRSMTGAGGDTLMSGSNGCGGGEQGRRAASIEAGAGNTRGVGALWDTSRGTVRGGSRVWTVDVFLALLIVN